MKAVNEDAAPDPKHGNRADEAQHPKERRHAVDGDLPDGACSRTSALSKVNAEIIRLYDDRYQAVHAGRDEKADSRQHECLRESV